MSSNRLIYIIIMVFTIIIVPLCNDKWQYIPMLAVMYFSPLFLLPRMMHLSKEELLPLIMLILIAVSGYFNPDLFRWSSFLYTGMFVSTYILFISCLRNSNINIIRMMKFLKIIIILYAIVLFVQQVSFLLHLPIINEAYGGGGEQSLKMNSLSIEPSNTGPIITLIVYVYVKLREYATNEVLGIKQLCKKEKIVMISFLYISILSVSVSCIFSLLVFLLYVIDFRHLLSRNLMVLLVVMCGTLIVIFFIPEIYERISNLMIAIVSLDPFIIYETDSSSSARLAPMLFYLREFNLLDVHCWLGYGMGYGGLHVFSELVGTEVEDSAGMGGIVTIFYDYGLLVGYIYMLTIWRICKGNTYSFWLFILVFVLQFTINHYITWLFAFCIQIINHYEREGVNFKYTQ